jgi:hypothetical protein
LGWLEKSHRDAIWHDDLNIADNLHGGARLGKDELSEALVRLLSHWDLGCSIFWIDVTEDILVQGVKGTLTIH